MDFRRLALALLVASAASPALSQNEPFESCDGYRPPRGTWDGMASRATLIGGRGAEPDRAALSLGGEGVSDCTAALADPLLLPNFGQRRASLLQARAMHRTAAGDRTAALADLDLADQALGDDPYGQRSLGLGTRLLRAFIQLGAGDRTGAAQNARRIMDAREFEPGIGVAAAQIHLAATGDWSVYATDVRRFARTNPSLLISLFVVALTRGNFAEAAEIHPQIILSNPRSRGGYEIQGLLERRIRTMALSVDLRGAYAYALAVTGRREGAATAIAEARAILAAAIAPPQPPTGRTHPTSAQRTEHAAFIDAATEAGQSIDRWERLIRLRSLVDAGNSQAAVADLLSGQPIGTDGASLDLIRAIARSGPGPAQEFAPVISTMEQTIANSLRQMTDPKVSDMIDALPEAQAANTSPTLRATSGLASFWNGNDDGFRANGSRIDGAQTIRFTSRRGSLGTTAEMALLQAARLARQNGRTGLLVLDKRQMTRTVVTTTMYGGAVGSQPNGQEIELDVLFVDPAALPAAYATARWRVIDVGAIIDALSPIYPASRQGS